MCLYFILYTNGVMRELLDINYALDIICIWMWFNNYIRICIFIYLYKLLWMWLWWWNVVIAIDCECDGWRMVVRVDRLCANRSRVWNGIIEMERSWRVRWITRTTICFWIHFDLLWLWRVRWIYSDGSIVKSVTCSVIYSDDRQLVD